MYGRDAAAAPQELVIVHRYEGKISQRGKQGRSNYGVRSTGLGRPNRVHFGPGDALPAAVTVERLVIWDAAERVPADDHPVPPRDGTAAPNLELPAALRL